MFGVIWLTRGAEVGRESSAISRPEDVVRYARAKASSGLLHGHGNAPDEFRIIDETGYELVREPLGRSRMVPPAIGRE